MHLSRRVSSNNGARPRSVVGRVSVIAVVTTALGIPIVRADVSEVGAYQTAISVEVPAFYGLTPEVRLAYSSDAPNGPVGVGWRLTAGSAIRRLSHSHGAPRFDPTDVFFVDGRELRPCTGSTSSSCAAGATHVFRVDTHQKVVLDPGTNEWTITDPDGTRSHYVAQLGKTNDVQRTVGWGLDRTADPFGHAVDYLYTCDADRACYVRSIRYGDGIVCKAGDERGPPGSQIEGGRIDFTWEVRSDVLQIANGLGFEELRWRLHRIEVFHAQGAVRQYQLDYVAGTGGGASLLRRVDELGRDRQTLGLQHEFDYPAAQGPMTPYSATSTPAAGTFAIGPLAPAVQELPSVWAGTATLTNTTIADQALFADFDGDGRADHLQYQFDSSCSQIVLRTRLAGTSADVVSTRAWTSFRANGPLLPRTCAGTVRPLDLDGDGISDLVFEQWTSGPVNDPRRSLALITLRATGAGTFAGPSAELATSIVDDAIQTPASCDVGDVDGDGRGDFVCTSWASSGPWRVVSELGLGDGGFLERASIHYATLGAARELSLADLNGDDRDDVVLTGIASDRIVPSQTCGTSAAGTLVCPHWSISAGISDGDGQYTWEQQALLEFAGFEDDEIWQKRRFVGDFDGDRRADLLFAVQTSAGTSFTVARNVGTGTNRWSTTFESVAGISKLTQLAVGATGDGTAKLLIAFYHPSHNAECGEAAIAKAHYDTRAIALDPTTFRFINATTAREQAMCGRSLFAHDLQPAEVDGDGQVDWVGYAYDETSNDRVVRDQPAFLTAFHGKDHWRRADVDGDGHEDWISVAFANPGLRVDTVRTLAGGGFQRTSVVIASSPFGDSRTADSARTWIVADVGGPSRVADGRSDIVVVDDRAGVVSTLLAQGNGSWGVTRAFGFAIPRTAQSWLAADVDGDGLADLVRTTPITPGGPALSVLVLRATGSGTWLPAQSLAFAGTVPRLAAFRVLDLDGDGLDDLVHLDVSRQPAGSLATTIRTLRSHGDGTFSPRTQMVAQLLADADRYSVADVNGDGRDDLARVDVVSSFTAITSALLGRGDGSFTEAVTASVGGAIDRSLDLHRGLVAADLDEDGRTDYYRVFVAPDSSGTTATTLQVVWNRTTGYVGQVTRLPAISGVDTPAFQLDDADADGRPDLVRLGGAVDRVLLGAPSSRMVSAGNGLGGRYEISYTTSAGLSENLPVGVVMPLVAQVATLDRGGRQLDTVSYAYANLHYDYGRGQVLGAARVTATGTRASITTSFQLDDRCGARPAVVELRELLGGLVTRTSHSFVPDSIGGVAPYVCLDAAVTREECEKTSACRTTKTHVVYDAYGNAAETWEEGDITDATDDRLTTSPASVNVASWIVSRPAYRMVSAARPAGWRMLAYTEYLYDGASTWSTAPTTGLVTTVRRWNDQNGTFAVDTTTFDSWGNPVKHRGPATPHAPAGAVHTTAYDCAFHRFPVEQCDPVGCSTTTWDEALGVPRQTTDSNGAVTTETYDPFARRIRTELADGSVLTLSQPDWTSSEPFLRTARSDGSPVDGVLWVDTFFDGLGRTTSTREEGGRRTDVEYDGSSARVTRRSNPYLPGDPVRSTIVSYDAADRPTQTTLPGGARRTIRYGVGLVQTIDELGATRDRLTDGFGRTIAIIEYLRACLDGVDGCPIADRYHTTYGWDALDRSTWIRDTNGNFTTHAYDSLSRRLEACTPDRGCTRTAYADDGLPLEQVDELKNEHRSTYDAAGRETGRTTSDRHGNVARSVAYHWDVGANGAPAGASRGRLVEIRDDGTAAIERRRTYDVMGRASSQEDCIDGQCETLAQRYDLAGRLQTITYPDGSTASYVYDARGLLSAIPTQATFLYDDATYKPTKVIYGNGVIEVRHYDPDRLWLHEIDLVANKGAFVERVTYDLAGRVRGIGTDRSTGSTTLAYSYDDLGRLRVVSTSDPALDARYDYDGIGNVITDSNRGTVAYSDPLHPHAPTATGTGQAFVYDGLGQRVESDRSALTWDADGNLIKIVDKISKAAVSYKYDVAGERVARTDAGGTELAFGPLVERDASGQLVTYVMAHGQAFARRDASGTRYLHRDHLGTVRTLTDTAGDVTDERDYSTWGESTSSVALASVPQVFAGGTLEADHRVIQLGARYYEPESHAFLSADTVIPDMFAPQSLNSYSYAYNNPASLVDPSGHAPTDPEPYWDADCACYGLDLTDRSTGDAGTIGEVRSDDLVETTPAVSTSSTVVARTNTIVDTATAVIEELASLANEIDAIPHDVYRFWGYEREYKMELPIASIGVVNEGMLLAGHSSSEGLYAETLVAIGPMVEVKTPRELYFSGFLATVTPLAAQRPAAHSKEPGLLIEGGYGPIFVGSYDFGHGARGVYGGVRAFHMVFGGAGMSFESLLYPGRVQAAVTRRAFEKLTSVFR